MIAPPPSSTLFPYTTLFRSRRGDVLARLHAQSRDEFVRLRPHRVLELSDALLVPGLIRTVLRGGARRDRKSTRLNSSYSQISYAVFCLNKKICSSRADSISL